MQRRHFLKTFVLGTAAAGFLGKPWKASVLADVVPSNAGLLRVRLSDFPALSEEFGSVRLGLNPIDDPNGPLGYFYPILINRGSGNTFYALDSFCSHAGCIVPTFDPAEFAIRCPCHGSGYGIDGTLLNGPASNPLIRFPITFDGDDTLTISVPNLGYCVTTTLVQSATAPRLALKFPTFYGVEYEVKFRARVTDEWTTAAFAFTPDGAADQLSMVGDSSDATVFVERTTATGFYSIAIKVLDLS